MPLRDMHPITASQLGVIVEDAASEIFIFSATNFRFLLVNRGARQNLGYDFAELAHLTPWDIKPELDERQFREKVRPLLESGSGDMVFETIHQRKDGSTYDVSVHLQLIEQDGERIFFAAIRDVTRENRLRRSLEEREKELEEALAGREILLQEVNHRVKNSLQVVTALLQLHARQVKDEKLKSALGEAKNRVAVVAAIHQRLYMSGEHSMVDVGVFLEELVSATVQSLSLRQSVNTQLNLEEGLTLGIERAVPLALVISELLTNSLKYAFVGRSKGTLGVELCSKDTDITVRVYDDGVGYASADPDKAGSGLGSKVIGALSKQMRADLNIDTGENGTSVTLVLPRG